MCYILKCCGWALDFMQGILTFVLACLLICVLCIGVSTAIIAGIAYGYHYSLAEFLTFTRHDVAVYVRRGHFQDRPDLKPSRRSGDVEDLFQSNKMDYQDLTRSRSDTKPLADTWSKVQDTKQYAEKLNKYSEIQQHPEAQLVKVIVSRPTPFANRILSVAPLLATTAAYLAARPQIEMRNFRPVHDKDQQTTPPTINADEDFYNDDAKYKDKKKTNDKKKKVAKSHFIPMRHWGITTTRTNDDSLDDIDEDHIVYKPV